jgi:hypothetical protein
MARPAPHPRVPRRYPAVISCATITDSRLRATRRCRQCEIVANIRSAPHPSFVQPAHPLDNRRHPDCPSDVTSVHEGIDITLDLCLIEGISPQQHRHGSVARTGPVCSFSSRNTTRELYRVSCLPRQCCRFAYGRTRRTRRSEPRMRHRWVRLHKLYHHRP